MRKKIDFLEFVKIKGNKLKEIIKERNKVYGNNFEQTGKVLSILYPNGITLTTEKQFNRFGIIMQIAGKLARYTNNEKPHQDSLDDLINYGTILAYLDFEMPEPVIQDVEEDENKEKK